jgi:amino acid transporter
MNEYKKNSLSLIGTVALGTGVMIGAGIFALLGQIAELAGSWFPYIFLVGAIISAFSAYSYIKVSSTYPSAGGIAMILTKAYGKTTLTASAALLMAFSMVINESLVARTFGAYTLQFFDGANSALLQPLLGVGLLIVAFLINISGNAIIERSSQILAFVKIGGLLIFALAALWAAGLRPEVFLPASRPGTDQSVLSILAALAFSILAFKGFTTITNSGAEITNPKQNIARAIILSLVICLAIYLLSAFAVASSLSIPEIVKAKDYALAEAARPVLGQTGLTLTIVIAIVATVSGVIASIFAVSRMTAMLVDMKMIPHSHFGMPGPVQKHMLVYVVVLAIVLTIFFDLSRIASMGAIFYLIMDAIVHWGVLRHLRKETGAKAPVMIIAMVLDILVLVAFIWVKVKSDPFVVIFTLAGIVLIFIGEAVFLSLSKKGSSSEMKMKM